MYEFTFIAANNRQRLLVNNKDETKVAGTKE